jgi:hypothetical protein
VVQCVGDPDEKVLTHTNDGEVEVPVYFVVDTHSSSDAGDFVLAWKIGFGGAPPPPPPPALFPPPRTRHHPVDGTTNFSCYQHHYRLAPPQPQLTRMTCKT